MAQSPDWPNQALLERRRQEAIAADPDHASTLAQCERNTLTLPQTMLHCAEALANAGRNAEAAEEARRAWVAGIADATEAGFLRRWSGAVRPDDQWERFQRLASARSGRGGAPGPAPGSAAPRGRRGAAGAAARRARTPDALVAALSEPLRRDPGMVLDRARWLRRCRPHRGRACAVAARRRGRTARRAGG